MEQGPTTQNQLSALQQALFVVQKLKSKLARIEAKQSEPIAIIGMGCRFPGDADSPEAFWELLKNSTDAITQVTADRWSVQDYYDPDPDSPGKMYTRSAGFLKQVDRFDSQFFGIAPREANSLDPQQRLLLEVTWEALENSGIAPQQLQGSRTGTFIGIGQNDYAQVQDFSDPTVIDVYSASGNGFSFASGRLSYILGLRGPNLAIDTACSSSLVAIHYACQSLRKGECEQAIAGGVQLILSPEVTIGLSRMRALSPDGRCKTFAANADGYGRGEGCGVIVLKRLSDALTADDPILAVIKGSAVNHNGASSGLTVPNGVAQAALLEQALQDARVNPADIGYVEAHGTGTALGDPIEAEALATVFGDTHSKEHPLLVGSVKTNVGHLEAAAGIVGLAKVILALQHRAIPAHLHFQKPNPHIPWQDIPLQIPVQLTPWQNSGNSRMAGVSSFGISGTNAHIILEEAPCPVKTPLAETVDRPHLLTLSAKTPSALPELLQRYLNLLQHYPDVAVADLCYTSQVGRNHFAHRLGLVAHSRVDLQAQLQTLAREDFSDRPAAISSMPQVAFLFTGQGSQYPGMGRDLYESNSVFRSWLDECDRLLRPHLETPLLEVLYGSSTNLLDQTAYTQPALFALEYALVQVWQSWGVQPIAVL
ncbi:MAG: type I polyketide synthase, partial [Cyanobacteria bacterium P01_E01_bin.34]